MKRFTERTAELLFDFCKFVAATVIVGRLFVSLDGGKITDTDFVLAASLSVSALVLGYVFDYLALKRGKNEFYTYSYGYAWGYSCGWYGIYRFGK